MLHFTLYLPIRVLTTYKNCVIKIHVIRENEAWTAPLFAALEARNLPFENWHLDTGRVDPRAIPPEGVVYNRMSASSHTRDHRFAPELARHVLTWLESHGRRTINGTGAIRLEIDKLAQYAALEAHGIRTPRTIGAVGRDQVIQAARELTAHDRGQAPFILKPVRGGAGAGVQLIDSIDQLAAGSMIQPPRSRSTAPGWSSNMSAPTNRQSPVASLLAVASATQFASTRARGSSSARRMPATCRTGARGSRSLRASTIPFLPATAP